MQATDLLLQPVLAGISLIANTLSAFAGGGAGLVQLPALILLGLPFPMALATHKLASVALGLGAAGRHWREGSLDGRLSALMLVAGLPGVWLGSSLVLRFPDRLATAALGLLTICLGLNSARRSGSEGVRAGSQISWERCRFGGLVLFAIGFLNGSLTSGTGLFVTMWLVHWFGLSYTRAVAHTLILVGLCWNGTGALVLGFSGEIRWEWLPMLIAGSLMGGYLGAHLSVSHGDHRVKQAFELLALSMGVSLLFRSLWAG